MFEIGDTVMYGSSGVCKIADIRREKFGQEERTYYVIHPLHDTNSTIYAPIDSPKISIRRLLSAEEIYQLIREMPEKEVAWIDSDPLRKDTYTALLRHGTHSDLIGLIRTLYFKKEEKRAAGRKFGVADERIMKEAESILHSEFAHVLQIRPDEVVPFIMGELQAKKHSIAHD